MRKLILAIIEVTGGDELSSDDIIKIMNDAIDDRADQGHPAWQEHEKLVISVEKLEA